MPQNPDPALPVRGARHPAYPFSAVVEPGDLALALVLSAVAPQIGGVLVRGEKGTAKSTIVRALAAVASGPLVELPVGATEDRVLGSLHLGRALADGTAEYEPGLLARADGGILYVDEVNLLPDHLVDVLLDAAATGRVTVERDGVSATRDARFVLVGTMNPEEGELRPQLLDRFGLAVAVAAPRDPALRVEVVRRRMAYDADPVAFAEVWAAEEAALAARIGEARARVGAVVLPDAVLVGIAELCAAAEVDGLRADLVIARAASAHAAWCGRTEVTRDDVRVAARLALPHRRRRDPFDPPSLEPDELDDLLDDALGPEEDPDDDPDGGGDGDGGGDDGGDGSDDGPQDGPEAPQDQQGSSGEKGENADGGEGQAPPTSREQAGAPPRARLFTVPGTGRGTSGRRSRAIGERGRVVGSRTPHGPGDAAGGLHLTATLRAALPHQDARGRTQGRPVLAADDLRLAVREGREGNLVVLCVDASGSMAARRRMREVKTAVLSLLVDAYQRRDTVALVTFRGTGAELVLPPTGSVEVAARRLDDVAAGGRTPLAEGLEEVGRLLARERRRDGRRRPLLVLVTDGRATAGPDAVARSQAAAAALAGFGVATVVLDCESGPMRLGLAATLASRLRAEHVPVGEVDAAALTGAVRARVA